MYKLLTSEQYLNSKAAFGRTQEGNSYAISQLPCGSRVVLIPGYPPLPAEKRPQEALKRLGPPLAERPRKLLPHMVDETARSLKCNLAKSKPNVEQAIALRDLQGGQWCNECATKDIVD